MPVNYTIISQKNPVNPTAEPKFYARARAVGQDNISTIAKAISEDCTPNEEDCLIVVDGIMKQINQGLLDGKIVKIDRFGTFRATIHNRGEHCPTAEEYMKDPSKFNSQNAIAGINIIFTPAKELKLAIKNAPVKRYVPIMESPSIAKLREQQGGGTPAE